MQASVRDLKNRLSEYLRHVGEGEIVTVTSRGKPVARIIPFPEPELDQASAVQARLAALPWVRMGNGEPLQGLKKGIKLRGEGPTAAEIVLEGRD